MTDEELKKTTAEFFRKYPNVRGLNARQMRDILDGNLVMVKVKGRQGKFILMTKEEVAPGGKLDQMNAEIRRIKTEREKRIRETLGEVSDPALFKRLIAKLE